MLLLELLYAVLLIVKNRSCERERARHAQLGERDNDHAVLKFELRCDGGNLCMALSVAAKKARVGGERSPRGGGDQDVRLASQHGPKRKTQ